MDEGETLLTDWRSLSWAGKGLQGDVNLRKVGLVVWLCVCVVVSYDIISHHHSRGVPLERTRKGPLKHSPHHTPAREDLRQKPVVPPHGEPLMGNPSWGSPHGDIHHRILLLRTLLLSTSDPKMGDPPPPSHMGKGRKKGRGKGGSRH